MTIRAILAFVGFPSLFIGILLFVLHWGTYIKEYPNEYGTLAKDYIDFAKILLIIGGVCAIWLMLLSG